MTDTIAPETKATLLENHFSALEDHRRTDRGNHQHLLSDILLLTISAMLCGAGDWELIKTFGDGQLPWLRKYGSFANGIPSSDTLGRFFAALDPKSFNKCFIGWIESIRNKHSDEIVAVDGKTIRGADPKKKGNGMPHIVSAFASANGLCLGQVKVSQKSNEITAIPELLELLALEGCIVTIDAMGCQKDIAKKIIDCKADYILAVKGNQGNLEQAIADTVLLEKPDTVDVEEEFDHGRIEKRTCRAYSEIGHIDKPEKWKGLKTIAVIDTEVCDKSTGKISKEQRCYISSKPADAKMLNRGIRKHWSVENNLHWMLDVQFGEDGSRKRAGNVAQNNNIVLKMAMTLLTSNKSGKLSIACKRLKAAINQKYREKLIGF